MRTDMTLILAVAFIAAGCSTSKQNSAVVYPPAELVQVAPTADGQGATAAINVAAVRSWSVGNIGRATWKQKWKIFSGAAGMYAYRQGWHQDILDEVRNKDDDDKPRGASGSFGIGADGRAEGEFENVTGSVTVTTEKKEPTPEGTKETTVTIEIDQNDKD